MIHASYFKPRVYPIFSDDAHAEIDRVQELTGSSTLNRTKIEEVGRVGIVDWRKSAPAVSLTLRQLEYGSMEFYRKLANVGSTVNTIEWIDFKTSAVDIAGFKTDDDGTFLGTIWYPLLRMGGLGLTLGDPDANIERNFTLVGEDEIELLNDNKYLIYKRFRATGSPATDETFTVASPSPIADPDRSGQYLLRVAKTTSTGVTTELTHGLQWSYDGTNTLTINGASTAGTVYRVWYSSGSYITGESTFTLNDTDVAGITSESVSIFLESSNQLYRLQSVGVDTTFDRFDIREIGNKYVVARGVRDITNRITLGRLLEDFTIEEVIRGKAGLSYGKLDLRELGDKVNLIIKIYEDNTKTTFKLGYKFLDLAPSGLDAGIPVNEYVTRGATLEGEEAFVTNTEAVL